MDFSKKIIIENEIAADFRVSIACRIMIAFMAVVALLNILNIFVVKPEYLYPTVVISMIIFALPTIFYNVLKLHKRWMRYVIIGLLILESGILFAVLSYHTIIMLVFPLIVTCLYNRRKYVLITILASIPVIISSHFICYYLDVIPDDPHTTLKGVIIFGILPRVIEFIAVGVVCLFITGNTEKLVGNLASKNKELYDDQQAIIEALSEIIEAQSNHTGKHVKRVSEYTAILCQGLGYSEEETWKVSLAAMMHDVGKIVIPNEILEKPGKLTQEEFEVIKTHVAHGKRLLENAPGEIMSISKLIAYHHHEKYNGKGYMGLKGEQIDKYARVVALADVYDALISKRPYKDKFSLDESYNIIVSESGQHFDPKVVDVFIDKYELIKQVSIKYPD